MTAGRAPRLGDEHRESLRRLAEAHVIVIDEDDAIVFAPPFSASPTPFIVRYDAVEAFGPCIWDALGILAMAKRDGIVETSCGCCGHPMTLHVENGELRERDGVAHYLVPALKFWDDIVFT